jgi:hypothetical protein
MGIEGDVKLEEEFLNEVVSKFLKTEGHATRATTFKFQKFPLSA